MRAKTLLVVASLLVALSAGIVAFAYFTGTGSGSALASVGSLTTPGTPTASVSGSTVTLSWSASMVTGGGTVGYHVERRQSSGSTWSDVCGSSASAPILGTSCSDTSVPDGTYRYRVTALYRTWTAPSAESDAVTVDASAPTVTIDTVSKPLLNASDTATDVTWHANENGTYSVRVGGTSCATGTQVASGSYTSQPGTVTTTIAAASLAEGANTVRVCVTDAGTNTGAAAATVTKDTTPPDAPVSAVLANGGGTGNAYVNNANKASVTIDVTLDASSQASDTIALTVRDAGDAHTLTRSASGTAGAGTAQFTGLDLTSFLDGAITISATARDQAGNVSTSTSSTVTKDTVAPDQPTSVAIANGGGAGNAYINSANKSSVSYTVAIPAGASNQTSDTVTVRLTSGASVTGTKTPSSPGGNVTVTGINAISLTDGSVDVSATATDLAGNTSAAKTGTTPKDVIAPDQPTSVAIANGGGQGNSYVNSANVASVNFNVGWTASGNNSATDTISLTITNGASAAGSSSRGGSSPTAVTGVNATALSQGTVSASATATDLAGNTSSGFSTANAATKDTIAPDAPTSISMANGGGAGNAYVNLANVASVSFNVGWTGSANNSASDTISLTISNGASAAGSSSRGGSSPTSVTGVDSTSLSDGTVSATATATDLAGNSSGAFSNANVATKDTVRPATPTSVAITNGGGTGNAYINLANRGAVTFDIGTGGNGSGDTLTLTLTSSGGGGSASGTATRGASSPTSVTVNASSAPNDGTITATARATDAAGNDSAGTASNGSTITKDTVRPANPTSVALANGGGTGNAYVNLANRSAVAFNVGTGSNAAGDTITVTLTSTGGGGSATGTATRGASSPTSVTVNASSAPNDGTITATAKATDPAGNDSAGTVTNGSTITKDTVAPSLTLNVSVTGQKATFSGTGGVATGDNTSVTVRYCETANVTGSQPLTCSTGLATTTSNSFNATTGAYSTPQTGSLGNGKAFTAEAAQADAAGNVAYATKTFAT